MSVRILKSKTYDVVTPFDQQIVFVSSIRAFRPLEQKYLDEAGVIVEHNEQDGYMSVTLPEGAKYGTRHELVDIHDPSYIDRCTFFAMDCPSITFINVILEEEYENGVWTRNIDIESPTYSYAEEPDGTIHVGPVF